jgi:phage shock protein C
MNASRRLYRSRHNRVIAGICGGLADYFGVDPSLVRIILVVVSLLPGPSVIFYLIAWAIIPQEPN